MEELTSRKCDDGNRWLAKFKRSIAVANDEGIRFYSLDLEKDKKLTTTSELFLKEVHIIRLFQHRLIIVSEDAPFTIKAWHVGNNNIQEIQPEQPHMCLKFMSKILKVDGWIKENREGFILVCFEEKLLHVLDACTLHSLLEINNKDRDCSIIATCAASGFFAYYNENGHICVKSVSSPKKNVAIIDAHLHKLAAMAFSHSGKTIATASILGTLVRVYLVDNGDCLHTFRRSSLWGADIMSLSFNLSDTLLASASNTKTVHIYNLEPSEDNAWAQIFLGIRSSMVARLPDIGTGNTCAFVSTEGMLYLAIANLEGKLYIFDTSVNDVNECHHFQTLSLHGPSESKTGSGESSESSSRPPSVDSAGWAVGNESQVRTRHASTSTCRRSVSVGTAALPSTSDMRIRHSSASAAVASSRVTRQRSVSAAVGSASRLGSAASTSERSAAANIAENSFLLSWLGLGKFN